MIVRTHDCLWNQLILIAEAFGKRGLLRETTDDGSEVTGSIHRDSHRSATRF